MALLRPSFVTMPDQGHNSEPEKVQPKTEAKERKLKLKKTI